MNELGDSVQHLSISSPVKKTNEKRGKRKPRKKKGKKEKRTRQEACDDGGQDAHISKDSSSGAGCISEGHLQNEDNTRSSETPLQNESRLVSDPAVINTPVQMPNYVTGAIPKKHTSVKTDSCKKPCTQGMDQSLQHDEAERCHDSVQTPGTSAAGKSHKEQESKTMSKPPSPDEPAAHSTGSEVDLIKPQWDLSSTVGLQGGPQKSALQVIGENNTTIVLNESPGAQIFIPPKTGELNVNTETNALDIETNSEAASRAAQRCKDELKIKYTTTGRYVQTVPGVEDAKRDIKEIYTNLQYTHGKTQSSGYNFLTTPELGIKRVIIAGTAGSGKSTLLCKIAYDWATGEKTLSNYELVLSVSVRDRMQLILYRPVRHLGGHI